MKESCENISDLLIDYADGQLGTEQSNRVAEHLTECDRCRTLLEGLDKSLELTGVIWEDGLRQTDFIGAERPGSVAERLRPWCIATVAAVLVIAATCILWPLMREPSQEPPTFAEIEQKIAEAGNAARVLAAADLLAQYPEAKAAANRQYRYIIETYPDTTAATAARARIERSFLRR